MEIPERSLDHSQRRALLLLLQRAALGVKMAAIKVEASATTDDGEVKAKTDKSGKMTKQQREMLKKEEQKKAKEEEEKLAAAAAKEKALDAQEAAEQ